MLKTLSSFSLICFEIADLVPVVWDLSGKQPELVCQTALQIAKDRNGLRRELAVYVDVSFVTLD